MKGFRHLAYACPLLAAMALLYLIITSEPKQALYSDEIIISGKSRCFEDNLTGCVYLGKRFDESVVNFGSTEKYVIGDKLYAACVIVRLDDTLARACSTNWRRERKALYHKDYDEAMEYING